MMIAQGSQTIFDKRPTAATNTNQRLSYIYYAAQFIEQENPEEMSLNVLEHLENAMLICYAPGE
jgi:hypothetical protein